MIRNPAKYAGTALATLGILYAYYLIFRRMFGRHSQDDRFIDVDQKAGSQAKITQKLIDEILTLKQKETIDYDKIEEIIKQSQQEAKAAEIKSFKSFSDYFLSIKAVLEQKAAISDQKASILLDKGTAYSRWNDEAISAFMFDRSLHRVDSWLHHRQPRPRELQDG